MKTVSEVCKLTGVSARTLHYYDEIGLLVPAVTTDTGYRMYDDTNLERLQQILLFRELEFSLKDIKTIVESDSFDRKTALSQQIELLRLKKDHIERLISLAERIKQNGENIMDFEAFDKKKIEEYAAEAKKVWGETNAYREYEQKAADYSEEKQKALAENLMSIFAEFGEMKNLSPECTEVRRRVKKLQDYITANYYTCTDSILKGLGQMYAAGGEMTENIDKAGGTGTAAFVAKAIELLA